MPGFGFSIPYNNNIETLKIIESKFEDRPNGNKIENIYLSAPQEYFGSGRIVKGIDLKHLKEVISFCKKVNCGVNVVFNSTCEDVEWYSSRFVSKTLFIVKKLNELGVNTITLANPLFIKKVREKIKNIEIVASAFCDIDSLERAKYYENLGASEIVPNGINRDFKTLETIKSSTDLKIRLMVNEGCLWQCPYRIAHTNYTSHASRKGTDILDFPSMACVYERVKDPVVLLKSEWIRPEDLKFYKKITTKFKIVGRTMSSEWINNVVGFYLNESFDGNLLEILESATPVYLKIKPTVIDNKQLNGFLEKVINCKRNCTECDYCDEMSKKVIKFIQ